jgi:hypothetical protein
MILNRPARIHEGESEGCWQAEFRMPAAKHGKSYFGSVQVTVVRSPLSTVKQLPEMRCAAL